MPSCFAHASSLEELLAKTAERASVLDVFTAYLHQRWMKGCTDAAQLTKELKAQGYTGSDQTVRRYLRPFRPGRPTSPPRPATPTVREVTGWILRRPDALDPEEQTRLQELLARWPPARADSGHVAAFAELLTGLHGDRLDGWIAAVEADDLPGLHSFATGLRRDHRAVSNGLRLPYSSGPVEGNVNRIKMLSGRCTAVPASTCSANGFCLLERSCSDQTATAPAQHWPGSRSTVCKRKGRDLTVREQATDTHRGRNAWIHQQRPPVVATGIEGEHPDRAVRLLQQGVHHHQWPDGRLLPCAPLGNRLQPTATVLACFPPCSGARHLPPLAISCNHGAP